MRCSVLLAAFASLGALALSATAAAQPSSGAPSRAEVRALLSGIEDVPSAEDWRRVGPRVLPALIALYDDPAEPPYVRLRAVAATAAFPSPAVRTFLRAVARANEGAPAPADLFVREAVLALGRAFGAEALEELRGSLDHPEPVVREAAARQLGRIGAAPGSPDAARRAARAALRAQLSAEALPHVRETLAQALRAAAPSEGRAADPLRR